MVSEGKRQTTRILVIVLLNVVLLSAIAFSASLSSGSGQSQVENSIVYHLRMSYIDISSSDNTLAFNLEATGSVYLIKNATEVRSNAMVTYDVPLLNDSKTMTETSTGVYSTPISEQFIIVSESGDVENFEVVPEEIIVRVDGVDKYNSHVDSFGDISVSDFIATYEASPDISITGTIGNVQISNLDIMTYEIPVEIIVRQQIMSNGAPLVNATLTYSLPDHNYYETVITDADGIADVCINDKILITTSGGEIVELAEPIVLPTESDVIAFWGPGPSPTPTPVKEHRHLSITVSTDKEKYVNGENVHISGKVTDEQGNVGGATVSLTIKKDETGVPTVHTDSMTTAPDGTYSFDYRIPDTAGAGDYVVEVRASKADTSDIDYHDGTSSTRYKVVGDVYIDSVGFQRCIKMGTEFDVDVTIVGQLSPKHEITLEIQDPQSNTILSKKKKAEQRNSFSDIKIPVTSPVGVYKLITRLTYDGNQMYNKYDDLYVRFNFENPYVDLEDGGFHGNRINYDLSIFDPVVYEKAIGLVNGEEGPFQSAVILYTVIQNAFDWQTPYPNKDVKQILQEPSMTLSNLEICKNTEKNYINNVQCMDYANVLTSLLRSIGIPARPVTGERIKYTNGVDWSTSFHVWTESLINPTWYVFDPTDDFFNNIWVENGVHGTRLEYGQGIERVDGNALGKIITEDQNRNNIELIGEYKGSSSNVAQASYVLNLSLNNESFKVGDSVIANITIINNENTQIKVTLNYSITSSSMWIATKTSDILFESTEEVTIPALESISIFKSYRLPTNLSSDNFYSAIVETDGETSIADFTVFPLYDLPITKPDAVDINRTFDVALNVTNTAGHAINNISVKIVPSSNFNMSQSPTKLLGTLQPDTIAVFNWNLTTVKSGSGLITFIVDSENGGSITTQDWIRVCGPEKLLVRITANDTVPYDGTLEIKASIHNIWYQQLSNVTVTLTLPANLSTPESLTKSVGDLSGGENSTVNWTANANELGEYEYEVFAEDETGKYNATDGGGVIVYEEGHGIDVLIDSICKGFRKDCKSTKGVIKDDFVNFTITIQNKGKDDIVDVHMLKSYMNWTAELYGGSRVFVPFSVFTPANTSHNLTLKLKPYPCEEVGKEIYVEVYATSQKDRRKDDSVIAHSIIIPESMFSVTPQKVDLTINHSSQESFNITISNKGSTIINNISLTPSGSIAPWTTLDKTHISSLEPGQSENVSVTIAVPKYQAPDTYTGAIDITSDDGGAASVQVSVTVPVSYEVDSNVAPAYNAVVPGNTTSYNVTITNEGNVIDNFGVSVENSTRPGVGNISRSWVSADRASTILNPGESDLITLNIMPPRKWYTKPGIYPFVVNVSSNRTHDTNEADLEVLAFHKVDIDLTGSYAVNPPRQVIDDDVKKEVKKNPKGEINVIIKTKEKPGNGHKQSIENEGGKVKYSYHLINAMAAKVPAKSVDAIAAKKFVVRIELDSEVHAVLDTSVMCINVSYVQSIGLDGSGVDVAVLDTGINYSHTAFKNIGIGYDFVCGDNYADDENGHGTHVSGIIASNDLTYSGVAPNATIMPIKVLDETGIGNASTVIAGIEWAVDHGAEVISMSLGGPGGNGTSALSEASDSAVSKGVVVVVAAGNDGSASGTIASPGDAREVITVGAIDDYDSVPDWSSRGPTTDGRTKPDVVAPGVSITSTALNGGFTAKSGTSMSTPHVSGTAVLLIQAYQPAPEQVKEAFKETAIDLGYDNNTQGAGKIDVDGAYQYLTEIYKAITQEVYPGGTAFYDYKVTNLGNVNDTFNIILNPHDFHESFEAYPTMINLSWVNITDSVSLIPGGNISDQARIGVPDSWAGMENTTYTFTIEATSISDSSASDSEDGRMVALATKRSMAEYIDIELEERRNDVNESGIQQGVNNSLLCKIDNAIKKKEQALELIKGGEEKQANNMLKACENIINAFINEVEAQTGNKIPEDIADSLIRSAQEIIENINETITTPIS